MPSIDSRRIGVAFDMHGCPNRCRHCYLGPARLATMSVDDVRRAVGALRDYIARTDSPIRELSVATWFREPDHNDAYRRLYELEERTGLARA